MRIFIPNWSTLKTQIERIMRQGISPRRLALTLALGFALGCIPVIGIPTALCAMVALLFRLNLPVMQAANYIAMPFQLALIVPLARLGVWISVWIAPFAAHRAIDLQVLTHSPLELFRHSSGQLLRQLGFLAGEALLAWLLVAIPVVLLLTVALTSVLRRVPALCAPQTAE
ncbi:DUF2062 domain-containing protein [Terracidiphilus gabretensis]|jgi:uncharacterized protein (DUF2062 family)|uniref:DUF2062 domain-containing protein n=1 Tax=Terracidiphilus gabretensis TaxID=1577687 RepID=UPI0009E8164B|nr:DUF2062 domain-containing protein [Terracidiphilus gabretensis]